MIKVWIVDDHIIFINGIKNLLNGVNDIKITGEALNGREAVDLLDNQEHPDIILMDLKMPVMDGQEATRLVKQRNPEIKIIMITMHLAPETVTPILDSGANGYMMKNTGKQELIQALHQVSKGDPYFSNEVASALVASYRLSEQAKTEKEQPIELTGREQEVLKLILGELTTSEIAAQLGLSPHTVDTYRKNLLVKVNVKNTAGLVKWALKNNFH
ncbi:MAG: response regulator transcription factor [Bacteroidia bacterium]